MKKLILLSTLFPALLLQSCASTVTSEHNYVRIRGTQFELEGKPYYFTGTNFWYGCYLGAQGDVGDRERLLRELDALKELGVTNLRVLAGSETSYIDKSLKPAIQPEPGVFNEQLLEGLDFLLDEMRKRNMHAIVILNNYWEWSGGFTAYNYWINQSDVVNPYNHIQTWDEFMNYSSRFYSNEKANELFRNFILKIITRQNKYSGVFYRQDPTIMSWQLANEPRPGGMNAFTVQNVNSYCNWIEETAKYIKSLDPNHLVSTGSEGYMGSLQKDSVFIKAHKSRYVDYLTFHLWSKNWSWFDAKRAQETFPTAVENALGYINQHINYARKIEKPIVLEEFGLGRDLESCDDNSTTIFRDKYFEIIYDAVYDSAKTGAPIAGTNFWAWSGEGRKKNDDAAWRVGDPFTGDPPHEPQGLNSIFNSDESTLKIIKEHNEAMIKLRENRFIK